MPGKTVPQCVGPDTPAVGNLASLSGPTDRLLHPPPDRYSRHINQSALPNGPEAGGHGQGRLQFRKGIIYLTSQTVADTLVL